MRQMLRPYLAYCLLLPIVAGLMGCGDSTTTSTKVAFLSYVSAASYQIKLMNNDGTAVTSAGTADEYASARLSPDGKKILFSVIVSGQGTEIGIMNVDGSGRTMLTTSGSNILPQFTPDGTKIIYQAFISGRTDTVLMNVDGTSPVTFSNPTYQYFNPTVSPDGKTIALVVNITGGQALATMKSDGTGLPTLIVNVSGAYVSNPAFSSDGTKILYGYYNGTTSNNIYSVNLDGSSPTQLTTGNYDTIPVVVGSKVLFESARASSNHTLYQIYSMNPDGSGVTQLTNDSFFDGFLVFYA